MPISRQRLFLLTLLALFAFAANSVLCRLALEQTSIDAAEFIAIRLGSGALVLWLLVMMRGGTSIRAMLGEGSWLSACALLAAQLIRRYDVTFEPGASLPRPKVDLVLKPMETLRLRFSVRCEPQGR